MYRIGAERQCAFVDVPPPVAPAFQRIRDAMDLRRCVQSRCYYDLLAANAASEAASASGAAPSVASGGSGVAAMDTSSGSGGGGSNSSVAITVTTRAAFIPLPESGWDENEAVAVQKRLKISLVRAHALVHWLAVCSYLCVWSIVMFSLRLVCVTKCLNCSLY